jgi:lysophospholipase L1-like esterase
MKKIQLFLLLFLLLIGMTACQTTTTTTTQTTSATTVSTTTTTTGVLAVPSNLAIVDNIVTFDGVANASKYRIQATHTLTQTASEYFVTSGFDLFLLLDPGMYSFRIKAVGAALFADSPYGDPVEAEIKDPSQTNRLEGASLNDYQFIRWLGRTWYDDVNERRYFFYTASGFEIAFYGTELSVTFYATNDIIPYKRAYLSVLVDGDENPLNASTVVLDQATKTVKVVEGLTEGYHTVKVLKRSEAQDSDTAVYAIETDGHIAAAPQAKPIKIQVLAASSSTGYGNLATGVNDPRTSANSHGLLGFAYLAAYMLDADINIVASSGWGVTRGWNTGGQISTTQTLVNAYDYVGINASNTIYANAGRWDHTDYIPDVIILNMGTNDFNAPTNPTYDAMTLAQKQALIDAFVDAYVTFILNLRNHHPNAVIIVGYGLMGDSAKLAAPSQAIVAECLETIDNVYYFQMEAAGTNGQPFGSGYHPNVGTHVRVAQALTDYIIELTGYEQVRQNIPY